MATRTAVATKAKSNIDRLAGKFGTVNREKIKAAIKSASPFYKFPEGKVRFYFGPPPKGQDSPLVPLFKHWNIGPEGKVFACPRRTTGDRCYICQVTRSMSKEESADFYARAGYIAYIWVVKEPEKGWQLVSFGKQQAEAILGFIEADDEYGDVLSYTEGRVFINERVGSGKNGTKHTITVGGTNQPWPDALVDYAAENEVPSLIDVVERELRDASWDAMKSAWNADFLDEDDDDFDDDDEDDDDDEVVAPRRAPAATKAKAKARRVVEEEDDEDEDEADEDEDIDDDEDVDEDEDIDEDDDDDEEDEEPAPRRSSKTKAAPAAAAPSVRRVSQSDRRGRINDRLQRAAR